MSVVTLERRGPILLVSLNRPEVLNAVDGALTDELSAALQELENSEHLRVGVITGTGRAFCAGLDMKAVSEGAKIEATRHERFGFAGISTRMLTKPIVAAVNGDAVGGGFEIALACDVIVMAASARVGLPEVRHGLFAAGGGVYRIMQQLPEKVALEMLLTGRLFNAVEAKSWGLCCSVVPVENVLDEAFRLAELIAGNAPLAIQATKRLAAARGLSATDAEAIELAAREAEIVFSSRDAAEGMSAFTEGRAPIFTAN
jgi:enoyl-CoA hydratase/carnithine racemase